MCQENVRWDVLPVVHALLRSPSLDTGAVVAAEAIVCAARRRQDGDRDKGPDHVLAYLQEALLSEVRT